MHVSLAPGATIVGRYRLDSLLGEGSMGSVWAATRTDTGEWVALKFAKNRGDEHARKRFLREAQAMCAVRHPHVVAMHEVFEIDGSPVIAMELLVGESLADRLARETSLRLEDASLILLQVVSALRTAHPLGVVHRDLKPENIVLAFGAGGATVVKVVDFGLVKLMPGDDDPEDVSQLTATGTLLGTPAYMSPEQVLGLMDIDHRTDVWALGMIMYQCLSGVLPTSGDNIAQVVRNVLSARIPPLGETAPHLPAEVTSVVDRMLVRQRDERNIDLGDVKEVLARHAFGRRGSRDT